jgi:5-methylcytosine-specific restriction endonuclease McrA
MPESSVKNNRKAQERYRKNNFDKNTARVIDFFEKNPGKRKEYYSNWRKSNYAKALEDGRLKEHKRRALKLTNEHISYSEEQVLVKYGIDCHVCGHAIDMTAPRRVGVEGWELGLHLDHLVPLSRGGGDLLSNIRPAHGICNLKKNVTVMELQNE